MGFGAHRKCGVVDSRLKRRGAFCAMAARCVGALSSPNLTHSRWSSVGFR
jgi:hypothetical protein